ncbi:MAG: hypothetical protein R3212_09435, partial [Xanthomonadales bacterium]|nr:hypothetical protein [Xanthomonadales bacterium]
PAAFISSTADLVESAANLTTSSGAFPADVAQAWNKIGDGLDALKVASQGLFRESFDEISRRYQKRSEGYKTGQDSTKDELAQDLAGAAASSQGRLSVQRAFGGAVKPGDVLRGRLPSSDSRSRLQPGRFKGFREVVVNQGDTVQSLAAKYMGDANDWPHIVLANKLKAPYITASAQLPGTVHPGDRVSVPIPDNQQDPPTFTTGNPDDGASQIEALLGTDFERERLPNGKFGWAIDTAGGSTDVRKVSGLANLGQGLEGRLRTERGHNILYPNAGMPRQVGNRNTDDGIVSASYEARQQVLADRRVERITSLRFTNELDVRELATDVVPIGFSSARTILRQLT